MISLKYSLSLAVGLAACGWAAQANAVSISVFNTGVDNNGALLSAGAQDTHYQLDGTGAFVVNNAYPFPSGGGPWEPNTSNSQWIAPKADQTVGSAPGVYTYRTTFNLTGLDPNSAELSGQWAADNAADIILNGNPTHNTVDASTFSFVPFSIKSGFIPGVNTLTFVVDNVTDRINPTGVQVQISGTAAPIVGPPAPIPEPTNLALLGLGIAGLGLLRHRRYSA